MSDSVPGEPPATGRHGLPTVAYPPTQWRLLVRLPGRVVAAAASAGPDDPAGTVAEGLAGLAGIAAGRAFDSDLVRAVVAAIYAESDAYPEPPPEPDREMRIGRALAACRAAAVALDGRADPADSAAYRQWVQSLAARVCRAGGAPDAGSTDFLAALGEALGLG